MCCFVFHLGVVGETVGARSGKYNNSSNNSNSNEEGEGRKEKLLGLWRDEMRREKLKAAGGHSTRRRPTSTGASKERWRWPAARKRRD